MALSYYDAGRSVREMNGLNSRLTTEEAIGDEPRSDSAGDVNAIVQAYARVMRSEERLETAQRLAERTEEAITGLRLGTPGHCKKI